MSQGRMWTKLRALPLRKRSGSLSQKEEVGSWSTRRQCAVFPAAGLAAPSPVAWPFGMAPEPPSAPGPPSPGGLPRPPQALPVGSSRLSCHPAPQIPPWPACVIPLQT